MFHGCRAGVRRRILGWATVGALVIVAAPSTAVAADNESYRFTANSSRFSYLKSVCVSGEYTITEVVTQEIVSNRSGSGRVGTRRDAAKGSQHGSGKVVMRYSKVVQGPDPAPPEDSSAEYPTGGAVADWSPFTHTGVGIRVDLHIDGASFYSLAPPKKVGKSKTFSLDRPEQTRQWEEDNCAYEERSSMTGTLTVTRVR